MGELIVGIIIVVAVFLIVKDSKKKGYSKRYQALKRDHEAKLAEQAKQENQVKQAEQAKQEEQVKQSEADRQGKLGEQMIVDTLEYLDIYGKTLSNVYVPKTGGRGTTEIDIH